MESSCDWLDKNIFRKNIGDVVNEIIASNLNKEYKDLKWIIRDCPKTDFDAVCSFMVPVNIFKKYYSDLEVSVKEKIVKSCHDLYEVTQSWRVPLEKVVFKEKTFLFQVNLKLLTKFLLQHYSTTNQNNLHASLHPVDLSINFDTSHSRFIVVSYFDNTPSNIRTLLLTSLLYNTSCTFLQVSNSDKEMNASLLTELFKLPLTFQHDETTDLKRIQTVLQSSEFYHNASDSSQTKSYIKFDEKCISQFTKDKSHETVLNTKMHITSNVLKAISLLESHISRAVEIQTCFKIVQIGSNRNFLFAQQLSLLLLIYIESKNKKLFSGFQSLLFGCYNLFHEPVKTDFDSTSHILEQIENNLSESFAAKYGNKGNWMTLVKDMAPSLLKLNIFSVAPKSTVKNLLLDCESNYAKFIMYNYSRIATILNRHDEQVKSGYYPALPDFSKIDCSLLNDKSELMLLDQIWNFGGLRRSPSDLLGVFKPHLLVTFLNQLCRNFSCFYHQKHILGENFDHLLPLMHARLCLVKTVQSIMNQIFHHFHIVPLEQM